MHEELIALVTLILVLGIAAQWISWWLKLPSILLLLLIGIVAGPITGLLDPDAVFGPLPTLQPIDRRVGAGVTSSHAATMAGEAGRSIRPWPPALR